jgi:thiol-disulfide isomerase/thioredoxin
MGEQTPSAKRSTLPTYVWLAALAALAAFAAVYVMVGAPDNDPGAKMPGQTAPEAAKPAEAGSGRNPLSTGAMTTFVFKKPPAELPDVRFQNAEGQEVGLASLRGKVVLLNLWATWCAPCREEMPALDKLQAELGSDRFEVVALAVDKSGIEGAAKFFADNKIDNLALYADPTARSGPELKVIGMPTTILIGADGKEIGRLIGPAEWDSPEAKKLIEAQL